MTNMIIRRVKSDKQNSSLKREMNQSITPTILNLFMNEDKVKDEIFLNFFMDILITLKVIFQIIT